MSRSFDIVVVGAGIVGACAALCMAQQGRRVAVIEPRVPDSFRVDNELDLRVFAISLASKKLLQQLGVWETIALRRISPYRHMRVWENDADLVFDAALLGENELGWIIEHRVLQSTLWDALLSNGKLQVIAPAQIADIESSHAGHQLHLRHDKDANANDFVHADLLLIADGANSSTRQHFGFAMHAEDLLQTAIVAHVATELPHQATAWQRFLPTGPLALLPLIDGRCSIVWSLDRDEYERVVGLSDDAFNREVSAAFAHRLGPITLTTVRASFPLRTQWAKSFVADRCVLLGDAAHSVHPLAGQGLNLGLQDVASFDALARKAQMRERALADARVLARYARAREGAAVRAAQSFVWIKKGFGHPAWWLERLRSEGLGLLSRHSTIKRAMVMEASGL